MGPHPIGYNGIQFDMGEDSGLQYIYVDSNNVINGQTYYYAITAYDKGYDHDFFENGYTESENLQPIAPSECSVTLDLDYKGNVVSLSENAAIVLPRGEALGYVPPNTVGEGENFINHISGYGSGQISIEVIDPLAIKEATEYQVIFDTLETAEEISFSVRKQKLITETITINDSIAIASYDNIDVKMIIDSSLVNDSTVYDTTYPVLLTNDFDDTVFIYGIDYSLNSQIGTFTIYNSDLLTQGEITVSYRYFLLEDLATINGETDNPLFDGMRIIVKDTEYDLNEDSTRWTVGSCNYGLIAMNVSRFYPADFELQFEGNIGDSITVDPYGTVVPFRVKNVTHDDEPPFRISDFNQDGDWDPDESISIRPYGDISEGPLISIRFSQDSLSIADTTIYDTLITDSDTMYTDTTLYDTTYLEVIDPVVGDVFHIEIDRPFSMADVYSFTTKPSEIDIDNPKEELKKIAVVPNPYIVASSWGAKAPV